MGGTYIAYVTEEYTRGGQVYMGPDPFEDEEAHWKDSNEFGHRGFSGVVVFHGSASNKAEVIHGLKNAGYAEHTLVVKELR